MGAAQLYGLSIRTTGVGWASGIGRNGAIVGPLLGGALMAIELPLQLNFKAFAIPGAIAAEHGGSVDRPNSLPDDP